MAYPDWLSLGKLDAYSLSWLYLSFSLAKSIFAVFYLSLPLAAVGHRCSMLFGHTTSQAFSTCIAYGISILLFVAYYAHSAGIPLSITYALFNITGLTLGAFAIRAWYENPSNDVARSGRRFLKTVCLPIAFFSGLFFLSNLLTLRSTEVGPGVVGNNDLYFWAAAADQLLQRVDLENVLPHGAAYWEANLKGDANGTYLALAFAAVHLALSAFEATPLFLGAVLTWIALAITELVVLIFALRRSAALMVSTTVVSGAFFHYLSYNFFAGQLLATFGISVRFTGDSQYVFRT